MLLRRFLRRVALAIPIVLLTQTSCCTAIGYGIGSKVDKGHSPQESETLRRAVRQYGGRAVEVTTRDGRVVTGARENSHELDGLELRELYQSLADRSSAAPRLPLPGDTVLVAYGARKGWMRFEGFAGPKSESGVEFFDTTRVAAKLAFLPGMSTTVSVAWSLMERMQWADSTRLDDARLVLPVVARIPVSPRTFAVRTESGPSEEFRSWEVERIDTPRSKPATTIGTMTGLGVDVTLFYLLAQSMSGMGD
jgi:hypothetical protein